jgi:hypothetical protein
MSLVFQNIDPPPPSPPGECIPPAIVGEDTLAGRRGGWGSIFWKTRDIGLPSYSNNLSTLLPIPSATIFPLLTLHYLDSLDTEATGEGREEGQVDSYVFVGWGEDGERSI